MRNTRKDELNLQMTGSGFDDFNELLPGIAFKMDIHGDFIFYSQGIHNILQFAQQDTNQNINLYELIPEDQIETVKQRIQVSFDNQEKITIPTIIKVINSKHIPVFIHAIVKKVKPRNNQVVHGYIELCNSCSEQETHLLSNENKYRSILENLLEGVIVLQNNMVVYSNPSAYRVTGYTDNELKEMEFIQFVADEDRARIFQNYQRRLKGEVFPPYDIRIKSKDGNIRWYMINAIKTEWEGSDAILVYIMDIHTRKNTEEALKESENKLQDLLKNVPGCIFQYHFFNDTDYRIEFMSKGAETLFEKPLNELCNPESVYESIHPDDAGAFMHSLKHAYSDLTPWFTETRLQIKGKTKWIRGIATSKKEEDGSVVWNGVLLDITNEKKATLAVEYNHQLYKSLNTCLNEMICLEKLDEIYNFITTTLRQQYPDTAVIYSSVNELRDKVRMVSTAGIPEYQFKWIFEIAGFDLFNREFNIPPEHYPKYKSGQLVTFDKGFASFVGSELSHVVAKGIEKIIKIPTIHAIGINNDQQLIGIVFFFSKNPNFKADRVYLESFVNQAAVVINRKLMEDSLRKSEETFRHLIENQGEGVGLTDSNEVFQFANPAAHEIFGVKPGELINRPLTTFLPKESQEKIKNETKLRKNGKKSTYELEIMQKSGKTLPILVTVTPQFDNNGQFIGSFGVFRDISERKHAEQIIKQSEEHHRVLSNAATEMLFLNDLESIYTNIIAILQKQLPHTVIIFNTVDETRLKTKLIDIKGINNRILKKVFNLTGGNIIGNEYNLLPWHYEKYKHGKLIEFKGGLSDFASKEMPGFITKGIQKLVGIHKIYTLGIKQKDNLYAAINIFTINKADVFNHEFIESFVKQAGIVIERKKLEQSLIVSEEKFSSFMNKSSDAILLTDEEFKLMYINPAFENLSGYDFNEIKDYDIFELNYVLLPSAEKEKMSFQEVKDGFRHEIIESNQLEKGNSVDVAIQTKYGEQLIIQARFFVIRTDKGKRLGAICRDISEQKQKEKTLKALNATKDRLFSIIGHDLKNPLNNIIGFTHLMNQNFNAYSNDKLKKFIGLVHQSASSLSALLDNLLLWSNAQRDKITVDTVKLNLKEIVDGCFHLIRTSAEQKKLHLINNVDDYHYGYADRDMLTTVVRNLISNAIKFTNQEGMITVHSRPVNGFLVIGVTDTGIGMHSETVNKIFHLNEDHTSEGTAGEKGTGLGLIICKEFIEKNHGEIWVESTLGKGSTFYFSIPQSNPEAL